MLSIFVCLKVEADCVADTLYFSFYFKRGVTYKFQRGSDSNCEIPLSESCKISTMFFVL